MLREGDNMTSVKRANRSAALHILHEQGMISRKRLSEEMKLTPAAITKIVAELIEDGLICEGAVMPGGGAGRREVLISLNSANRYALGILINVGIATVCATRLDGETIFSETVKLARKAPADETLEMLCSRLSGLCLRHSLVRENCIGTGITIRGLISEDGRVVKNSFGAIDTKDYRICEKVEALTGFPSVLTNNVRALFIAQRFLSRSPDNEIQFFLRCEYGIGGALFVNGAIVDGSTGQCGEIGHVPLTRRGGKPCSCGKCGCLETVASPLAIIEDSLAILSEDATPILWRKVEQKGRDGIEFEDIIAAARNGDSGVSQVVENAIVALTMAVKSLIYVIDPGKVVLYGRMFDNPYCLNLIQAELSTGVDSSRKVTVERSAYNHQLESRAAGILAVEEYFNNGGYFNGNA